MLHYSLGDVQLQCRSPFLINKAIQQVEHTEKQFLHFLEVKHPYPPKKMWSKHDSSVANRFCT